MGFKAIQQPVRTRTKRNHIEVFLNEEKPQNVNQNGSGRKTEYNKQIKITS